MPPLLVLALYNVILSFLMSLIWSILAIVDRIRDRRSTALDTLKLVFKIGAALFGGIAGILSLLHLLFFSR